MVYLVTRASLVDPEKLLNPTEAGIIERGSNANGEYVRFADGTQICWTLNTSGPGITTGAGVEITWNFPAAFLSAPTLTGSGGVTTAGTTGIAARISVGLPAAPTVSSVRVHLWNSHTGSISSSLYLLVAVGRWF